MGISFMKVTNIVAIDVTQTLIVKIYFLPSKSNRNPKIMQLNIKVNSVLGSMLSSWKIRLIERMMKMIKS